MSNKMLRKPPLVLVMAGVLLVLLPLLACLQYQWLGKVSEREREQMHASLRRNLAEFRQDFDREIARVYFQFNLDPNPGDRSAGEYAKLYAHWNSTAPYPKLIQDIFFAAGAANEVQRLERLDLSSGSWQPADWTTEFGPRRFLEPGISVAGSPPAVLIPALGFATVHFVEPGFVMKDLERLIVRLDLQYIRNDFIPALVRLHFGDSAAEYLIHISDREDGSRVIYTTESGAAAGGDGDASDGLLALELGEFRNLIPATLPFHAEFMGSRVPTMQTFDVQVLHGITTMASPVEPGSEFNRGQWKIAVTHRAGSLDAAVGQIRYRNLALSFSILTLLAASVAIVLISAERARRLARQQMEFVSAVSHELRTPLAVICSAGENLADGVVRDAEQLKKYGKVVRNEGRRLTEMVEQVLSFAGIQSGLKKYRFVPTEVAPLVERALNAFEMPIQEGGFTVERTISNDRLTVLADPSSIERALQNLISNAIKYSGPSRWIGITVNQEGGWIRISVHDKGIGISASDRPHLFEPFYRGRSAVDGQIQGSGLGLSLVKQIVDAHQGKIDVVSDPEAGTTFCIRLPE